MDVDDALRILLYIYRSDQTEVAGQDNEIDRLLTHQGERSRPFT